MTKYRILMTNIILMTKSPASFYLND